MSVYYRAVTESINQLINICTVSAPGQKECDNALRQIEVSNSFIQFDGRKYDFAATLGKELNCLLLEDGSCRMVEYTV